jgi:hypothetical protein
VALKLKYILVKEVQEKRIWKTQLRLGIENICSKITTFMVKGFDHLGDSIF